MIVSNMAFRQLAKLCEERGWHLELFARKGKLFRLSITFQGKLLMTQAIRSGDVEKAAYSLQRLLTLRPDAHS